MSELFDFTSQGRPYIVLKRDDGREFKLDLTDYALFLREAKHNGWKPKGFSMDSEPFESMRLAGSYYLLPYGKGCVTDNDAKNLAQALKKMVDETDKFLNREIFDVKVHLINENFWFELEEFELSCANSCEVIKCMGGFIVICPQNINEYLLRHKANILMDFIEFCDLGEFSVRWITKRLSAYR